MKLITLYIDEEDYAAFKKEAVAQKRPTSSLIREAMAIYRSQKMSAKQDLTTIPLLSPKGILTPLHQREDMLDDFLDREET